MYTVEEIKNKVKTGTWTKEDVARCVEELSRYRILLFIQKKSII